MLFFVERFALDVGFVVQGARKRRGWLVTHLISSNIACLGGKGNSESRLGQDLSDGVRSPVDR